MSVTIYEFHNIVKYQVPLLLVSYSFAFKEWSKINILLGILENLIYEVYLE